MGFGMMAPPGAMAGTIAPLSYQQATFVTAPGAGAGGFASSSASVTMSNAGGHTVTHMGGSASTTKVITNDSGVDDAGANNSSFGGKLTRKVKFNHSLGVGSINVTLTVLKDPQYADTFQATVTHVDSHGFTYEIVRTDAGNQGKSWGRFVSVFRSFSVALSPSF